MFFALTIIQNFLCLLLLVVLAAAQLLLLGNLVWFYTFPLTLNETLDFKFEQPLCIYVASIRFNQKCFCIRVAVSSDKGLG